MKQLWINSLHSAPAATCWLSLKDHGALLPLTLAWLGLILVMPQPAPAQLAVDKPIITTEPDKLDFGVMNQQESQDKEIIIRNIGGEVLKIREVKPDCGCTIADVSKKELQPGEATTLKVTFNSKKFEGPQTKYVRIYSNDPDTPLLEYVIQADVHVPIYIKPPKRQLGFGRLRQGETNIQKAWLETHEVPELELKPVRYNSELFTIEIKNNTDGALNKAIMVVHSKPDAPVGNHREFIRLETNVPEMRTIDFEAFVDILQDLEVNPPKINFRYAQRDQVMKHKVHVRATGEDIKFKITGAEIDLPNFVSNVEETIPNQETIVYVSGRPLPTSDPRAKEAKGRMMGTLRIFTDLPHLPELQVTITYLLKM